MRIPVRTRKPFLTALIAVMALAALPLLARTQAPGPQAQSQSAQTGPGAPAWEAAAGNEQHFEAASVKVSAPGTPFSSSVPLDATSGPATDSLFRANAPLNAYLNFAFKISDSNQARAIYDNLPAWAKPPQFFQIEARAAGNPTRDQLRLMLQALLAERFQLQVHREMQTRPAYSVSLNQPGKAGPQLKPHPAEKTCLDNPGSAAIPAPVGAAAPYYCGMVNWTADGRRHIQLIDMTMPQLATILASQTALASGAQSPHSGIDNTGLTGRFDAQLEFTPDSNGPGSNVDTSGPDIFEALKEQLGLRMAESKAPVAVIVIDRLEKPSPNDQP